MSLCGPELEQYVRLHLKFWTDPECLVEHDVRPEFPHEDVSSYVELLLGLHHTRSPGIDESRSSSMCIIGTPSMVTPTCTITSRASGALPSNVPSPSQP